MASGWEHAKTWRTRPGGHASSRLLEKASRFRDAVFIEYTNALAQATVCRATRPAARVGRDRYNPLDRLEPRAAFGVGTGMLTTNGELPTMKTAVWVACLNVLALYGMWYITYWRYDLSWAPVDSQEYTDLAVHLWDRQLPTPDATTGETPTWATRPLRYRLLTPALARAARALPFYRWYNPRNPRVKDQLGPDVEPLVYYLVTLNFCYLVVASALVFHLAWTYFRVPFYLAYAGSLWFLTTFYNLLQSYPPHSDAGCHLLILAALVAYYQQSWRWFVVATLLGALQKETVILIVGLFLAFELVQGKRWALGWMLACLPALVLYKVVGWYWPVGGLEQFDPSWQWLTNLSRPFWA